jgi:ketosteroid isomerase-like protein
MVRDMDTRAQIEKLTAKFAKAVTDKDFAAIGPLRQGKSIVVWRRQKDGTLKIVADTFNSD